MKTSFIFFYLLLSIFCSRGKEKIYTASTPAGIVVRSFLGIPLSDSIDFIRWKLILNDKEYLLQCHYGIGQPNTNGFIRDGQKIEWKGPVVKKDNYYELHHNNKTLKLIQLNTDLLHLLDTNNSLLVGNGGWSYTLNTDKPSGSDQINITSKNSALKDSTIFDGRTPCHVPGVVAPGTPCYKLKWRVILYADAAKDEPAGYKIIGTAWRTQEGKKGDWKIINGKNGRTIYQLNDENGKGLVYLLKLDENILVFTGANGKLLVGDKDFSYTLNRKNN
jgi:hypothetical protein